MIKTLVFTKMDSLNDDENKIAINFSPHINVIIGPKGGGKSTLFNLVAGLKKNYIDRKTIAALKEFGLQFDKAILFSDEIIDERRINKVMQKDVDEDYKNRNDVIYQNDPIKNDLTSFKEIDKNKFNYVKNQVRISPEINSFIEKLRELYDAFNKLNWYNESNINWSNTFKFISNNDENKIHFITSLNYESKPLLSEINKEEKEWKQQIDNINEYNAKLLKFQSFKFNNLIKNDSFIEMIKSKSEKVINENNSIVELLKTRINEIKKIAKVIEIFEYSYLKEIEEIKNKNKLVSVLKDYETKAKNHFKNIASDTLCLRNIFESLFKDDFELEIVNNKNQESNLTFKIPTIEFSTEEMYTILKSLFYSPGSSMDDVVKWLDSLNKKGIKEFNEENILKEISKIVKDKTRVLVDKNKDYESLSLGQRSIYGLKYKFNKSINDDLFLDQPEDNLDNSTIAHDVLNLIEQKQKQQVFIVTHNANIGILTQPENVIVANLLNKEHPYKNVQLNKNEFSVNYLEGGREFLEKRYIEIFKNENGGIK